MIRAYPLYIESGPRHQKTMVHVLYLLGCIAQGPTTEQALEAAPEGIRTYLRFLQRHGAAVDPGEPFITSVAVHVTKGPWLGQGDPAPGFAPDFQPVAVEELDLYLRRLGWLHDDLLRLVAPLAADELCAQPAEGGRPVWPIVEHLVEAECNYVRATVGKVAGMPEAQRAVRQGPVALRTSLPVVWEIARQRLTAMSDTERTQQVPHGQVIWTARRGLRRMLEHNWEHLLEISRRLNVRKDNAV